MMEMRGKGKQRGKGSRIARAFALALGIFAVLTLLGGLFFWAFGVPEGVYGIWMLAVLCLAALFLGYGAARILGRGGLLAGGLTAAVLTVTLLGTAAFLLGFPENFKLFQPLYGLPLLCGMAGGFFGVGHAS